LSRTSRTSRTFLAPIVFYLDVCVVHTRCGHAYNYCYHPLLPQCVLPWSHVQQPKKTAIAYGNLTCESPFCLRHQTELHGAGGRVRHVLHFSSQYCVPLYDCCCHYSNYPLSTNYYYNYYLRYYLHYYSRTTAPCSLFARRACMCPRVAQLRRLLLLILCMLRRLLVLDQARL
jgi:hypothetical protein